MHMGSCDDRIQDFLIESRENLDQLDSDLVLLEKDPASRDLLAKVFRVIHTIKGTCGFFGFSRLEGLTHAGEEVLSRLREGRLPLDARILSALLRMGDAVRRMLATIEASRTDGEDDHGGLIRSLLAFPDGEPGPSRKAAGAEAREPPDRSEPPTPPPAAGAETSQGPGETSIRVDVDLLDNLMNLVGELVLTRNQMLQRIPGQGDRSLASASQRLNLVTSRLQEEVMKTRLQHIGALWDRFPRIVRDLAVSCGKQVRLEMEGEETELDKSLVEAIRDPLIHLLRNSIDHGIEGPATRAALGKPPEGCVHLRAFHENGQVRVEVRDDGSGMDPDRLRRKAIETGLLAPERAARLGDREAIDLIFLPGFSTAKVVTNVSGRGVGLDVVKTNVEKVGGSVDVDSRPGKGTTFSLKIPLTLAVIPVLIVTSGGERFAIPQVHLLEVVRLMPEKASRAIEAVHGTPVYRLRGSLLPIVDLNRELRLEAATENPGVNLLVLQAEGLRFGLLADRIHDTEEIVVKPLGKHLQALSAFAGATVMGDGKVALILDVLGIALRAGLGQRRAAAGAVDRGAASEACAPGREKLLLLKGPGGSRFAVPLHRVARLEQVPGTSLERLGGRDVMQHRGAILPLFRLDALAEELAGAACRPSAAPGTGVPAARNGFVYVVVHSHAGGSTGLVVDDIIDIVEETLAVQPLGARQGILGSMVIQGRAVEVVDLEAVARIADPSLVEASMTEVAGVGHG